MIRSIYLVSRLRPSGPINQALNIVTAFGRDEVHPIVVTLFGEETDSWLERYRCCGVEVIQLGCGYLTLWKARRRLLSLIRRRKIDLVHSSGLCADLIGGSLPDSVAKIATVRSHISDLAEDRNVLVRSLARAVFRRSLRRMDLYVACSSALAESLSDGLNAPCPFVENGADNDRFIPADAQQKRAIRAEKGISDRRRVYLSVGVLYPRKNMSLLVDAFLAWDDPDSLLVIVGDGEEFESLLAQSAGSDRVLLAGSTDDPLAYYRLADVFVSTSLAEGLPNTVLEALSCGLPAILSDIGPHKEMLAYNPEAGRLFKSGSRDDLLASLSLSAGWDLAAKSVEARSLIDRHLSKYRMAEKYAELYEKLIRKR